MDRTRLTDPQMNALRALARIQEDTSRLSTPREVARELWPDSPGWEKRSSRRSNRTKQGALGATMPMKAGALLGRLREHGCALEYDGIWEVSSLGQRVLDGTAEPLAAPVRTREPQPERRLKTPLQRPGR